jgi:hypothetical protein
MKVRLLMEKELLFEGKENTTSVNIAEFSPKGAKLDINLGGKVSGKVAGFILSTHNILMKPGGTSEVSIRSIIFSNGEPIFVSGNATGKIVDPTPIGKIDGNLTFQAPSQRLAYLNTTKGWSEAFYNLATGEYTFKIYAVK